MANVTLGGSPITVNGKFPKAGESAPDFTLTGGDLKEVSLKDYAGKRKVLNIVPSLDTPVCQTSTRTFNQKASGLNNTVVLVISADLPFAGKRFCTTEGLNNVTSLSTFRSPAAAIIAELSVERTSDGTKTGRPSRLPRASASFRSRMLAETPPAMPTMRAPSQRAASNVLSTRELTTTRWKLAQKSATS